MAEHLFSIVFFFLKKVQMQEFRLGSADHNLSSEKAARRSCHESDIHWPPSFAIHRNSADTRDQAWRHQLRIDDVMFTAGPGEGH